MKHQVTLKYIASFIHASLTTGNISCSEVLFTNFAKSVGGDLYQMYVSIKTQINNKLSSTK